MAFRLDQLAGTNGFRLEGVSAFDGAGRSVAGAGDVNGDGVDDLVVGAPWADVDGNVYAGTAYVVFGGPTGFPPTLGLDALDGTNGFRLEKAAVDASVGRSVAGAGDLNGDGIDDLIVGTGDSECYVVFGTTEGFPAGIDLAALDGTDGFRIDRGGSAVASAGDVNGDGVDDLVVGEPYLGAGISWVVFGRTSGFGANLDLGTLDGSDGFRLNGAEGNDWAGASVDGAGDVNGDGIDDLIVGAASVGDIDSEFAAGESYVVFGTTEGFAPLVDLGALDGTNGFRLGGVYAYNGYDASVSGAGDFNGDGFDDLIVAARDAADNADGRIGASFVVFGTDAGFPATVDLATLDGANGFRIFNGGLADRIGSSVAGAGDVNGDGFADLLIGGERGAAYLVFGSADGIAASIDVSALDPTEGIRFEGGTDDYAAVSVAAAGDVNDDGIDDIFVGAPGFDVDGAESAGAAYVVFGSTDLGGANLGPEAAADTIAARALEIIDLAADHGAGPDQDPNLDTLTITAIDGIVLAVGESIVLGSGVRVTLMGGTDVRFDAPSMALGSLAASFTYEITDGRGGSASAVATLDLANNARALADLGGALELDHLDPGIGFRINGVGAADGAGSAVAGAGDVNGDGVADIVIGAPKVNGADGYDAGETYVVFGVDGGFAGDIDLAALDGSDGFKVPGLGFAGLSGTSVSGAGDVNGDGIDDLIIGAPQADGENLENTGESYVVFGSAEGFAATLDLAALDGTNGFQLGGPDAADYSGCSVSGAGDVNGDGIDDLVVGARQADPDGNRDVGETYVVFGSRDGFGPDLVLDHLDPTRGFRLDGVEGSYGSGRAVSAVGDINGDDIDDLVVGALGRGYVVFGSRDGFAPTVDLEDLDGSSGFAISFDTRAIYGGIAVADAGDVNGDGLDDLVLGWPGANDKTGAAYVVFGRSGGFAATLDVTALDGTDGFRLDGADFYDYTGTSVAGAGDINGDGFDDLLVGTNRTIFSGEYLPGQTYVIFGSGTGFARAVDATSGFRIVGAEARDGAGRSVDGAGDVNGDGIDDLVIGAPGFSYQGDTGASYVVFGSTTLGGSNDAPIATDDVLTVGPDATVDLAADHGGGADRDPDFDLLTIASINGAAVAAGDSIELAPGLVVSFLGGTDLRFADPILPPGTTIEASFAYELSDGRGGSDTASVTVSFAQDVIRLANLDGTNGFRIDGLAGGDRSGFAVAGTGDVNGDGFDDILIGAPYASPDDSFYAGESYVIFGSADGFGETFDLTALDGENGFRMTGAEAYHSSGYAVNDAGDINGDGIDDLAVSAWRSSFTSTGESFVVFGTADGFDARFSLADLDGTNGFRVGTYESSGRWTTGAGDINGDGIDDLIIGAPLGSPGGRYGAGQSYVVFGTDAGFAASLDLADLDGANGFRLDGVDEGDASGLIVDGAGDVNGDGIDDLVIGAFRADAGDADNAGETYVVFGTTDGFAPNFDLATLDGTNGFRVTGTVEYGESGDAVAGAGDVNGDGFDDVIIGAQGERGGAGASYVVFGAAGGFAASLELSALDGSNGFRIEGIAEGDQTGWSVAGAGDFNGDGYDDVLIGAFGADIERENNAGQSYLVFGSGDGFPAVLALSALDGRDGFGIDGAHRGDQSGYAVAGAGDLNGDGYDDLLVGAPGSYSDAAGQTFVIYGRASTPNDGEALPSPTPLDIPFDLS